MEEVDYILIQQLREIGCELDEDISGIKELEVHQIMSCVCHCVSLIKANDVNEWTTCQISANMNMSLKYKTATQLATICTQELGYKSDIGYQTFLYGNETEVRKLFLFLLEKLPKEDEENKLVSIGSTGLTANNILSQIHRLQISSIWLPFMTDDNEWENGCMNHYMNDWSMNRSLTKPLNVLNVKSILMNRVAPNRRKYYDLSLKLPNDLSSIMEWNYFLLNNDINDNQLITKSKKVSIETIAKSVEKSLVLKDETDGSLLSMIVSNKVTEEDSNVTNDETIGKEEMVESKNGKDRNEDRNGCLSIESIESLQTELSHYRKLINDQKAIESQLEECEESFIRESQRLRELESSDRTVSELISEINEVKDDISKMSHKWQDMQNILSNQLKQLRLESEAKNERSTSLHKQLNELKKSITAKVKEIKTKESLVQELTEKLPSEWPPSRASYTKRILEIVANVKKQNNETKKVLLETRALQKDINNLSGKLSRTFTVADEVIFKDAKSNEWNRKCYKLLASMHDHCDQLLQSVSTIGFILREIRQLEESVETERSRKTSSNLNRILADLDQIQLENQQLNKKINI